MGLGPRIDIRQSQSLVLTPQLTQAIKLLQLSNLELEAFIAEELAKNPLLEAVGGEDEGGEGRTLRRSFRRRGFRGGEESASEAPDRPRRRRADRRARRRRRPAARHRLAGRRRSRPTALPTSAAAAGGERRGVRLRPARMPARRRSPSICSTSCTALGGRGRRAGAGDRRNARRDRLSDRAAGRHRRRAPARRGPSVEQALALVQDLDPPGIGARNLAECLALQAKAADRYDPAMARLIDNLELLSRGQMAALKRICGVDDEDLADMVRELRAYDPKPGCRFVQRARRQRRARRVRAPHRAAAMRSS